MNELLYKEKNKSLLFASVAQITTLNKVVVDLSIFSIHMYTSFIYTYMKFSIYV